MIDHKEKIGLWLIKETYSFLSFKNMSVIEIGTFWHRRLDAITVSYRLFLQNASPVCSDWFKDHAFSYHAALYHIFINTVQVICWNFVNRVWLGLKHVLKSQWQCTQWTDYLSSNFNSCSEEKARAVTVLWPSTWIIYLWCCPSTCTAHCIAFAS